MDKLNYTKFGDSQIDNLVHVDLETHSYLLSEELSLSEKEPYYFLYFFPKNLFMEGPSQQIFH